MRKRRKVLVIIGLIALAAVCFVMLRSRNEPKYQGRYLSEWMATYEAAYNRLNSSAYNPAPPALAELKEAKRAIQAIGTNGLPCIIRWIQYEPPKWRRSLYDRLPSWLSDNRMAARCLLGDACNSDYGYLGIQMLGTNAVSAIPVLQARLNKPETSIDAIVALLQFGEDAIPAYEAALAGTNPYACMYTLSALSDLVCAGHTNTYLPLIVQTLNHKNASVREDATNALRRVAPQLLTNTPAQ